MAKIKKKEGENLTETNIEKVIGLLEQEKPITKKQACEILNISYNTTRLAKIIEEYKEEKLRDERRRAANRGKPVQPHEIQSVISSYLDGDSLSDIAKNIYRSVAFVKRIIEDIGIPSKTVGHDYFKPPVLPEKCMSDTFETGQIVWNTRHNGMAIVLGEAPSRQDYKVYKVYNLEVIEEDSPYFRSIQDYGGYHANTAAFDLGNLEHLKEYGIDIYKPYRNTFPKWLAGR